MAMHDLLILPLAYAAGGGLGAVFFGGLWWTIRQAVSSSQPALWFFVSLLLRIAVVLIGFYVVSDTRWERMVACLVGFVMARLAVTWLTRPTGEGHTRPGTGGLPCALALIS